MEQKNEKQEIAIRISNVKKMYKLGQIGGGTLQADLQSWWAKIRGKEDPNVKIGEEQKARLVGQTFMALNGVDLTVYKGEALGIIGGNGAGKSTLLKLISQVTAPTEGKIQLWGRVASMLEVGTGFNGEMTGRENVYMNGAILGMTKDEIDAKMEDIIEFSEVRDFIDTPVKRYSSGMYVKLAFSVAAHLDSEIMIMDEVLAVGDMSFQKKCLGKMGEESAVKGKTILYVSHNMTTIRELCNRVVVLDKGRIIFEGDVNEGIRIYMEQGINNGSLSNSFIDRVRPSHVTQSAKINELSVIERNDVILRYGEMLKFEIHWVTKLIDRQLRFRIIVESNDGTRVGMALSSVVNYSTEHENITKLEWDCSRLAPGKYFFEILICEIDKLGRQEMHDSIEKALYFEIEQTKDDFEGLTWFQPWGRTTFPLMKLIN